MKPLLVLDSIVGQAGKLPLLDITNCGTVITSARELRYDPARVRAPFPTIAVGARIEPLAKNLCLDPFPAQLDHLGGVIEIGFVVLNKERLTGLPFTVLKGGSFGDVNCQVTVNHRGEIVPGRRMASLALFDLLVGRWFRAVVDCFYLLQNSKSFKLELVPLDVNKNEQRQRIAEDLPAHYLHLQARI